MLTNLFGLLLALVCLGLVFISLKTLFSRSVFVAWLKGTLGVFGLLLTIMAAFVSADLLSYSPVDNGRAIARVEIKRIGEQKYEINLHKESGEALAYKISGDLWQLDVRMVEWSGIFDFMGVPTGYRVERLSGRYFSIEQERGAERTVYDLFSQNWGTDLWTYASNHPWLPGIHARYGSATYVPLNDGAIYSVVLESGAVKALAENEVAKKAINDWN